MENKNNIEQFDEFFKENMKALEPELPADMWSSIDNAYQTGQAVGTSVAVSKTIVSIIIKAAAVIVPAVVIGYYLVATKSDDSDKAKEVKKQTRVLVTEQSAPSRKQEALPRPVEQTNTHVTGPNENTSASVQNPTGKEATRALVAGRSKNQRSIKPVDNEQGSTAPLVVKQGTGTKQPSEPGNNSSKATAPAAVNFEPEQQEICYGDIIQLTNTTTGNFASFHWDFDDGHTLDQVAKENITYRFDRPGVYNITLVGITREGQKLNVARKIKVAISQAYFVIDKSAYPEIKFSNQSKNAATFVWDFGDNSSLSTAKNPIHRFSGSDKVTVMLIAQNGTCTDTFRMDILPAAADVKGQLFIPNVITPDWDGINDVWQVKASNISTYHLTIMDKTGKVIKESTDYNEGWRGICSDGKPCPPGDYYYVLTISTDGKPEFTKTGTIKLIQ
ncbi:MAG: gliding motility-associated C-terminal domain-containing protein [Bacteroidia bacterium]|nr:gliding motility-associated C-terminal domain-containing protein [Bacteroidia bacterium]